MFIIMALVPAWANAAETAGDVVKKLAILDARDGFPAGMPASKATNMLARAAALCKPNNEVDDEVAHLGDMIAFTHNLLKKQNLNVSRYDLLDVVNGILGDGKAGHDCAAVLSMYATLRTMKEKQASHIEAYKVIQGLRDNGML
ncbi:ATPase [Mizugakiibacter sediminis]|uniref:ATPase n=1 Tax=Mizugakiibacter sediminis TaxID=1475481 RepID=A0A0K8QNK6_9GAMM|nr:hypothetical protein [Mizugakiibacter sediminis]GAP66286.1 ATPase [Mizugakiibacter sediminis]